MNLATRQFPLLLQINMITVSRGIFCSGRSIGSGGFIASDTSRRHSRMPSSGPSICNTIKLVAFEFCHILNCILIRWGSILSHHVYHNNKKNNGLGCFVKGPRCPIHLVFRTKLKPTIGTHDSRLVTNLGYLWHLYPPEKSTNFREYMHFSCLSMRCPRVGFFSKILRY